jgi:hypothetical protein
MCTVERCSERKRPTVVYPTKTPNTTWNATVHRISSANGRLMRGVAHSRVCLGFRV